MAGHVGLELGNVAANYPFERSLTFLEAASSGHRDLFGGYAGRTRAPECLYPVTTRLVAPSRPGRPLCLSQCVSLVLSSQVDRPVLVRAQILPRTPHAFRNLLIGDCFDASFSSPGSFRWRVAPARELGKRQLSRTSPYRPASGCRVPVGAGMDRAWSKN